MGIITVNSDIEKLFGYDKMMMYELNSSSIKNITFTENTLYVVNGIINPDTAVEYTIPKGCILRFEDGCYFGSNVTLNLNDTLIEANNTKIFDGTRIIGFMKNNIVPVEWFGAVGDGITDDSAAINACIKYSGRGVVKMDAQFYRVKSPIMFTEANWEETTYEDYSDNYFWSTDKGLVATGTIIGDAVLGVHPVIVLDLRGDVDLNVVYDLSEEENQAAISIIQVLHTFHVNKVFKMNDGQGMLLPDENDEVPNTPSGYGILFNGYSGPAASEYHIGQICGFRYGLAISDALSGTDNPNYNSGGMTLGHSKWYVDTIQACIHNVYVNLTTSASYFNGNEFVIGTISVRPLDNSPIELKRLYNGSAFYMHGVNRIKLAYNKLRTNYIEGAFNRVIDLYNCKGVDIFGGGVADSDFRWTDGITVTNHGQWRCLSGLAPYTDSGAYVIDQCMNVKMNFPYNWQMVGDRIFTVTNSYNVSLEGNLNYGYDNSYLLALDRILWNPKDGTWYFNSASTINKDMFAIIFPRYSTCMDKIIKVTEMPSNPDTSKLYAVEKNSDDGVANVTYKLMGYILTTEGYGTNGTNGTGTKEWVCLGYIDNIGF